MKFSWEKSCRAIFEFCLLDALLSLPYEIFVDYYVEGYRPRKCSCRNHLLLFTMFSSFLRHTNHQKAFSLSVLSLSLSFTTTNRKKTQTEAALPKEEELFENQCLKRQLFQPKLPYPAWDYDWDGHSIQGKNDLEGHKTGKARKVKGKTRHIILVRHGQYDESSQEDKDRILTQLGRLQATKTGQRLAEWAKGYNYFEDPDFNGPLAMVPTIHVSNMTRAKETALRRTATFTATNSK